MIITFFWNYLNHHQVLIADAMYDLLGDNFRFVATLPRNEKELKGGIDYSDHPYCVLAAENKDAYKRAMLYAEVADVCVFGACSQEYAVLRAKTLGSNRSMQQSCGSNRSMQQSCGSNSSRKLSFECGERWLKKGWINILSPHLRSWWLNYMRYYRKVNFYKLCSSAFAAQDDELLGCYKGRHYKWGYFTEVPSAVSSSKFQVPSIVPEILNLKSETCERTVRLMWCARFIDWKHPELAIECARRLKADGYKFQLDMYGDGLLRVTMENLAKKHGLQVCPPKDSLSSKLSALSYDVVFHGNVPNNEILQAMHNSDIFLFTSDRQEGWGAVANEAMAAGCCLIASDRLGAAPYLIRDGINGFMFRDKDATSLYEIVKHVMDNSELCAKLSKQAQTDMINLWSPRHAAESFLQLINDLQNGNDTSIAEGPCSKA